ncbi:MAG TPA: T3SS effector HopA1 family protein [Gemmatimonadota bacterium]|nr:T3SS effector HopA1 family protein [Gemmatimonadota bacterium]
MSSDCRRQVEAALAAVRMDAAGRPTWLGRPIPTVTSNEDDEDYRVEDLCAVLYRSFYCRGGITSADVRRLAAGPGERRRLLETLAAAVPDRHRWDKGWRVRRREGAALVVEKNGLELWASSTEWRSEQDDPPNSGAWVQLRVPADRWETSPGFLLVQGARLPSGDPKYKRSRIYLDLDVDGTHRLLEATDGWNTMGLPFVVKVVADPHVYERCDTAVAVVERRDFDRAGDAILASADAWAERLRPGTPAFARRMAPGVAVADDPPDGGSFGVLRCRQLAEGIARANREGAHSPEERLQIVESRFAEDGASIDALHLGPSSPEYDPGPWTMWWAAQDSNL